MEVCKMSVAAAENKTYKTSFINNRRYLGNKYKLLPFITGVVNDECSGVETVADIFAGTGAVASAFTDKNVITNDLMYSNYICNYAWFGADPYDPQIIIDYVVEYNSKTKFGENYMTRNFADTYFSKKDCAKIGYIREDIERNYKKGKINSMCKKSKKC
jgi:adenine-specific DNA-methyltransferase